MGLHIFETETYIDRPLNEVFDFFSKAENLNLLTPPGLQFQILTPLPIRMHTGTLIDYRLSLKGIPFRWKTEIAAWEPPFFFTDTQLKGPYRLWIHKHVFRSEKQGTLMHDRVAYSAPGWVLEPLINKLFVKKQVEKIFRYRQQKLDALFK